MGIEELPSEILFQVLRLLPPTCLARTSAVSRRLRRHANDDLLWELLIRDNVHSREIWPRPPSVNSWRELYERHHPYWFIVRHRIWHSDSWLRGDLLATHYEPATGAIGACAIHGREPPNQPLFAPFNPQILVWRNKPSLLLDVETSGKLHQPHEEVSLPTPPNVQSRLSLCQNIPVELQHPSMSLWPPWTLPATDRVRDQGPTMFATNQHRPRNLAAASDRAFRLRTSLNPLPGRESQTHVQPHQSTATFSALFRETYMPSKQKPWQGIWIGDYYSHGFEFLVVMQKRVSPNSERTELPETARGLPAGYHLVQSEVSNAQEGAEEAGSEDKGPFNRLEAIKLTGDPNVIRGQCTWLVEDLDKDLIRVAGGQEQFAGSRIYRSHMHIAEAGFRNDRYIASEMILHDENHIFQVWGVSFTLASRFEYVVDTDRNSTISLALRGWTLTIS